MHRFKKKFRKFCGLQPPCDHPQIVIELASSPSRKSLHCFWLTRIDQCVFELCKRKGKIRSVGGWVGWSFGYIATALWLSHRRVIRVAPDVSSRNTFSLLPTVLGARALNVLQWPPDNHSKANHQIQPSDTDRELSLQFIFFSAQKNDNSTTTFRQNHYSVFTIIESMFAI